MKSIYIVLSIVFFLTACSGKENFAFQIIDLSNVPIKKVAFDVFPLDTTKIIYPNGILAWKDYLVLATPKEENLFSFWNRETLEYEFSSTTKGQGPNDIAAIDVSYFRASDNGISVFDDNTIVEMVLDGKALKTVKRTPIITGDAVNGFSTFKSDDENYITLGVTYKVDKEHYKLNADTLIKFGDIPYPIYDNGVEDYEVVLFNHKISAGKQGKSVFYNFYNMLNLIRKYDVDGNLLAEYKLKGAEQKENTIFMYKDRKENPVTPYWDIPIATDKYIYVTFYRGQTMKELNQMFKASICPEKEVQIWDLEGNLLDRYIFDHNFNGFTVSEDGIMYAYNNFSGDTIYRYKFPINN